MSRVDIVLKEDRAWRVLAGTCPPEDSGSTSGWLLRESISCCTKRGAPREMGSQGSGMGLAIGSLKNAGPRLI